MYMRSVPFFKMNSTSDVCLVIGLTCFGNLKIDKHVYVFCTIFQDKFTCDVCLVIGLTYFGNFENFEN